MAHALHTLHLLVNFPHELDHLVSLGILVSQQEGEHTSPSIISPKKDSSICWISSLCQLNKVIKYMQYPLPIITDIFCK
jgi:hypothetical protein